MKRLVFLPALVVTLALAPAAAASPTVRLAILHVVNGCHVWGTQESKPFGASRTLVVKRGTKVEIRISCPMDYDVVQVAGPKVLAPSRWHTGTAHTLTFSKRGVVRIKATNVQSSEEMNLQTLGPDNPLVLTVRVR